MRQENKTAGKTAKKNSGSFDIYQAVTDRIVAMMEQGEIPWKKPWTGAMDGAISYSSRRPYSLLNQLLLGEAGEYITWTDIVKAGGALKKGAKAKMVVFWKQVVVQSHDKEGKPKVDENGKPVTHIIPMLRYYNVYAVKDCEGIKPHFNDVDKLPEVTPMRKGEMVIAAYLEREKTLVFETRKSNEAYYQPSADKVVVPLISQFFPAVEEYYSTAFHELTHSTLKKSRCDREAENAGVSFFGTTDYSREELVAELGAAMLMGHCKIETPASEKNSAAYLQSWLKVLKNDKKMIVAAASRAEAAARYILTGERKNLAVATK